MRRRHPITTRTYTLLPYTTLFRSDEAAAALGQLSGEFHASIKSAMLEDSRFVREVATARVRSAFEAAPATNMSIRAYGPDGPQSTSSDTEDRKSTRLNSSH